MYPPGTSGAPESVKGSSYTTDCGETAAIEDIELSAMTGTNTAKDDLCT